MKNLRRCNSCVVFLEDKKKSISLQPIYKTFLSVISNVLITHVWLFSTTTNSTVTGVQLFCTKNISRESLVSVFGPVLCRVTVSNAKRTYSIFMQSERKKNILSSEDLEMLL